MKVLILTSDAGLGHRQAAKALRDALNKRYDSTVETVNLMQHEEAPQLIRQLEQGYSDRVTNSAGLYEFLYDVVDSSLVTEVIREGMVRILRAALEDVLSDIQPDVIVSTYPMYAEATLTIQRKLGYSAPLGIAITDLGDVQSLWYHPEADLHFAPTEAIKQQALEHDVSPERVRVTGLPVDLAIADETRTPSELRQELGWEQDVLTALVVGGPRTSQVVAILDALQRADADLQIVAIAGGDDVLFERLQNHRGRDYRLYNWVDEMPQFMQAADFIVTKAGGVIVSEALACGLPLIISEALPGQEIGNAEYIVEAGAGVWPADIEQIQQTVEAWAAGQLSAVQSRAAAVGMPDAAYEISAALVELTS